MIQTYLPFPGLVRDVLGRERLSTRVWPDGSYNCPFCAAAVEGSVGHCRNPGCFANPQFPVAVAQRELVRSEEQTLAEETCKANHASAMLRIEDGRRGREATLRRIQEQAEEKGACVRCALKDAPYRVKFVKHRTVCPRGALKIEK